MTLKKVVTLGIFHSMYWFSIQMTISYLFAKLPLTFFEKYGHVFKSLSWEENGNLWNTLVQINRWKKYIPEGNKLIPNIYNKKQLTSFKTSNIYRMILEMRRAELVHWLSILPVIVFVKAPRYIKIINFCYALLANIPIIVAQRYNRPRLERYYQLKRKRGEHDV
ncbi:glycosyl-4,4'-diaponeurosporenoate acyltransferase [Staphylococcus devriesei]|uniref:glycosyl-4,4'-diaponeurosporenoate acyltransferase CrtO family protein n=1 Tax=Staphylococcus devriesei TaxID=586733 RepID=UPI000CD30AFB|nr:glycosyl-4,4'-diaponeurosporenoate acyltransferase [Staphylococcus devriesei]PNZ89175.1 glycosyl-4,4'-diaponeurosporenoate acyltransferase [Staphylococcus devriesei]SUM02654.1 Glycosyl-4,4-diaponeurosporenoate acyltransferase precursor [Staphylococcus devriesei]